MNEFLSFFFLKADYVEIYSTESNPIKTGCKKIKFHAVLAAFMWQWHLAGEVYVCDVLLFQIKLAKVVLRSAVCSQESSERNTRQPTLSD